MRDCMSAQCTTSGLQFHGFTVKQKQEFSNRVGSQLVIKLYSSSIFFFFLMLSINVFLQPPSYSNGLLAGFDLVLPDETQCC